MTCENLARCFKIPQGCNSSSECNLLISYKHNTGDDAFDMTIATNQGWGAFSQVPQLGFEKMVYSPVIVFFFFFFFFIVCKRKPKSKFLTNLGFLRDNNEQEN